MGKVSKLILLPWLILALLCIGIWQGYRAFNKPKPLGMINIPAGWFWMGCNPNDNQCDGDEKPYHKVYLNAYYIDKNDITVDEYTKCVKTGGCTQPHWDNCLVWNGSRWQYGTAGSEFQEGDKPVVCVDWTQSTTYCQWMGDKLPTEAQWEKAARGTDGRIYPWGNQFNCNNSCNSVRPCNETSTCKVGSYPQDKSPYRVMDMTGNVWDWCSDWYDANYYANSPNRNPWGPDSGDYRVLRGSVWINNYPMLIRSSGRYKITGANYGYFSFVGFRCIRQASQ